MTLLRRVPREVYRVYCEEEFLAGAARDESLQVAASKAWQPRRAAGVTLLLAVASAAGGLIAVDSRPSSIGPGRRGITQMLAVAGLLGSTREHAWRSVPTANSSRADSPARPRGSRGHVVQAIRARAVARALAARHTLPPQPVRVLPHASDRMPEGPGAPGEVTTPAGTADTASIAPATRPPQPAEFGFER